MQLKNTSNKKELVEMRRRILNDKDQNNQTMIVASGKTGSQSGGFMQRNFGEKSNKSIMRDSSNVSSRCNLDGGKSRNRTIRFKDRSREASLNSTKRSRASSKLHNYVPVDAYNPNRPEDHSSRRKTVDKPTPSQSPHHLTRPAKKCTLYMNEKIEMSMPNFQPYQEMPENYNLINIKPPKDKVKLYNTKISIPSQPLRKYTHSRKNFDDGSTSRYSSTSKVEVTTAKDGKQTVTIGLSNRRKEVYPEKDELDLKHTPRRKHQEWDPRNSDRQLSRDISTND
jgi:hypothetical protein